MISVLLPVHRLDPHLGQAINSVLAQTFGEFELLIIANGPHREKLLIELKTRFCDPRIRWLCSPVPQLAHALNLGLSEARYDWVARMDGDDVCYPERLALQLQYATRHPEIDVLGCEVTLIDETNREIGVWPRPQADAEIKALLGWKNPMCHPSVLMKKSTVLAVGGYNAGFQSEDFDLWLRLARRDAVFHNLPSRLLKYRRHSNSAQGTKLGFAEAAGHLLREFLLTGKPRYFFGALGFVARVFVKGR